jgi:hypothetical protein
MNHLDLMELWLLNIKVRNFNLIYLVVTIRFFFLLVEWCTDESFNENSSSDVIVHSDIVKNCFFREYVIRDLPIGQKCYVRVSAGNMRGFGPSAIANPPYCVPSSRLNIFKIVF